MKKKNTGKKGKFSGFHDFLLTITVYPQLLFKAVNQVEHYGVHLKCKTITNINTHEIMLLDMLASTWPNSIDWLYEWLDWTLPKLINTEEYQGWSQLNQLVFRVYKLVPAGSLVTILWLQLISVRYRSHKVVMNVKILLVHDLKSITIILNLAILI